MKAKFIIQLLILICILAACQTATPPSSINVPMGTEFNLSAGQSTIITGTDLTVTFDSVTSDGRCPSEVECAASGPVTVSLSLQQENEPATSLTLQTFTDQNGHAPNRDFEGIENRVEVGDFLIQIMGVFPYPKNLSAQIKQTKYQVTLLVSSK